MPNLDAYALKRDALQDLEALCERGRIDLPYGDASYTATRAAWIGERLDTLRLAVWTALKAVGDTLNIAFSAVQEAYQGVPATLLRGIH